MEMTTKLEAPVQKIVNLVNATAWQGEHNNLTTTQRHTDLRPVMLKPARC